MTTLDLFIAISIFIFLLAFFAIFWNYIALRMNSLNFEDSMKRDLLLISDLLVKYPGNETTWHLNCNPTILGLGRENVLELGKVKALSNSSCLSYSQLKSLLGTSYEFLFELRNSTHLIARAGKFPINASKAFKIRRIVLVDGQIAWADVILWV